MVNHEEDPTHRAASDAALATRTFTLTVVAGPNQGAALVLDATRPPRVLVGKGPVCDLRLDDPLASRRHLAVDIAPHALRLVDLGSTNGTSVNGLRVVEVWLRGGESVRLGATTLRVDVAFDDPRAPSAVPAPAPSAPADRFGRVLGTSAEMRRLFPIARRLASRDVAVLVEGEPGTGKELLAESIHEESPRARGPFVVCDCAHVDAWRLHVELFGEERAGAVHKGLLEQAQGGTLFLDEIGELDPSLQPKLLRALERSEIQRAGGGAPIRVDVRVVAATRRDLDKAVQQGRFRDDLFLRLAAGRIELPPLRARKGDVSFLAQELWTSLGGDPPVLAPELVARLCDHTWPGNVRELYNAVARLAALGDVELRAPAAAHAPAAVDVVEETLAQDLPFPRARDRVLDAFERRYVERVLAAHGGNVARAAAASGIARRYFQIIRARSR